MGFENAFNFNKKEKFADKEDNRRKMKAALHLAILGYLALNPDGAATAGKREAARIAEGLKMSDTIKPGVVAEDMPQKDDDEKGTVKYTIKG